MKDEQEQVFNNAGFHTLYSKSTTQISCYSTNTVEYSFAIRLACVLGPSVRTDEAI